MQLLLNEPNLRLEFCTMCQPAGDGEVVIRPFAPRDQSQAGELILSGLEAHWGVRDAERNPDLTDISRSYTDGIFLVACESDRIVGTGALRIRSAGVAEIVRMSVAADRRRRGIGRTMLRELLMAAEGAGMREVTLETTETWDTAIQFYLAQGFRITHHAAGDVHFVLELKQGA